MRMSDTHIDAGKYIPERVAGHRYVKFLLEVTHCGSCMRDMMPIAKNRSFESGIFPSWIKATQVAQMKRAGIVQRSVASNRNGAVICVECRDRGLATFICVLCKEERSSDMMKESIGDPAEHLCTPCFESVPAKKWCEELDRLQESHKYDWE